MARVLFGQGSNPARPSGPKSDVLTTEHHVSLIPFVFCALDEKIQTKAAVQIVATKFLLQKCLNLVCVELLLDEAARNLQRYRQSHLIEVFRNANERPMSSLFPNAVCGLIITQE